MEVDLSMFLSNKIMWIICGGMGALLMIAIIALFWVSRRSQRVMDSILRFMTNPDQARVQDANRVLHTLLTDQVARIQAVFNAMSATTDAHIAAATRLNEELTLQNEKLVALANAATKKLVVMSQRLDNTVSGLRDVVRSKSWADVEKATEKFDETVMALLTSIDQTSNTAAARVENIQTLIDGWLESGRILSEGLSDEFNKNTTHMQEMTEQSAALREELSALSQSVEDGFNGVKNAASGYESVMKDNDKMLGGHITKMENFSKSAKKQLTAQVNTLTDTANAVGAQVRLAESSIDKQVRRLGEVSKTFSNTASATEDSVRGVSGELTTLTNAFNKNIKDFANEVVAEIKTVSGVANVTLENTKTAAGAFSESVKTMASSVRETLIEMNTAHTQLSGQSASLIKMSAETTAQLQPLSQLIEQYYAALPDLSRGSVEANESLEKIVANINDKITTMRDTVDQSVNAISESSVKLEDLAGQSRQQMIDLMADYAKAVTTMQTLNKQMMVARASAPMDAIKSAPTENFATISSQDFIAQSERMFEKMHEQTLDLTRAIGAEIPDVVWKKYHAGDKTIFSKWLAKMMVAADKKRVRNMLKSDTVFRSQATQFVRSFDKVLTLARQSDNADKMAATLMKSDLGQIYVALKNHV